MLDEKNKAFPSVDYLPFEIGDRLNPVTQSGRQNNAPTPKSACPNLRNLRTVPYVDISPCDGVDDLEMEEDPGLSRWVQGRHKRPYRREEVGQTWRGLCDDRGRGQSDGCGTIWACLCWLWRWKKGTTVKECWVAPGPEKARQGFFPEGRQLSMP